MPRRPHAPKHGFTLIDVTLTILIVGILASVAVPRLARTLDQQRVIAAAKRLATDLKYARSHARARNSVETVSFDVPGHRYALSTARHLDRPDSAYSVNLASYPYHAEIVEVDFAGETWVNFNAFGIPSRGGRLVVQSGRFQRTIMLQADTGLTTVE